MKYIGKYSTVLILDFLFQNVIRVNVRFKISVSIEEEEMLAYEKVYIYKQHHHLANL